ncbi:MAG: calycin-like domain-containing protein, partial [Paramuribaculum sp.]|nr:calycin-like domain-containing protein [Paramuribaculum sp.]
PFNTANTSGSNKDGGSFGGINFAYRPDAIGFQYQREQASGSSEPATVVVYSWKGTATQANVRGNIASSPKTVTMTDRDRNILNMETAYGDTPTYTDDFARIATVNHSITAATSGWTYAELPLQYESTATPEKINVIFSAGDYFQTTPEKDNTLTVDDVKLLYYSRLASLSVNGAAVEGFNSNTYAYTLDTEMPEESAFAFTCLGNSGSGKATLSLDKENAVATITVTNSNNGGTDVDGQTSHVYTVQFKKAATAPTTPGAYEGKMYTGTLNIKLGDFLDLTQDDKVYIKDNGDGTCKFTLPNFTMDLGDGPANFGDITVENVAMTKNADGTISYAGSVKGLSLADGEIIADVELSGAETADGQLTMNLPVRWAGLTIDVKF